MKLVAWNCCDAFRGRKVEAVAALAPDILVLSEVRRDALDALASETAWVGPERSKGLGLVGFNGWRIDPLTGPSSKYFLPAVARRGDLSVFILGVWAHPEPQYASSIRAAIDAVRDRLVGPAILAGDFNHTVAVDGRFPEAHRFAPIVAELQSCGLRSAWHEHRGEAHGAETATTYFHRRDAMSPFTSISCSRPTICCDR